MENEVFNYTYSAKDQEEIKAIRKKYAPAEEEDKMAQLRRLDAAVTQKATILSLICGMIGALVMGSGMSLLMSDLADVLKLQQTTAILIGLGLGIVGIILVCAAYPLYNRTVKKERERIAPEILRLSDELLK